MSQSSIVLEDYHDYSTANQAFLMNEDLRADQLYKHNHLTLIT